MSDNQLDTEIHRNWTNLIHKLDSVFEKNEKNPFDLNIEDINDANVIYEHKSNLLETKLVLKELENTFIEIDIIEEKQKAMQESKELQKVEKLKSIHDDEEDDNVNLSVTTDSKISTETPSKENTTELKLNKPLDSSEGKVTKLIEDRRKKLLSALPSQPRKFSTPPNNVLNKVNVKPEVIKEESETTSIPNMPRTSGKGQSEHSSKEKPIKNKRGISAYTNSYNPKSCYITIGSTVAYKPKLTSHGGSMKRKIPEEMSDWFQCVVLKILNEEGTRFEIQDIEAAETGQNKDIYRCNSREIIHIPLNKEVQEKNQSLKLYPVGMRCLGRYPDTTTFYPAVVLGRQTVNGVNYCILRFDGEEEVDKETLVERQHVLILPKK
ncbi:Sgf29 protein [Hanseniaspora uvarum]|nr:Sgf29 protein [Hanseniaspora uvarum]